MLQSLLILLFAPMFSCKHTGNPVTRDPSNTDGVTWGCGKDRRWDSKSTDTWMEQVTDYKARWRCLASVENTMHLENYPWKTAAQCCARGCGPKGWCTACQSLLPALRRPPPTQNGDKSVWRTKKSDEVTEKTNILADTVRCFTVLIKLNHWMQQCSCPAVFFFFFTLPDCSLWILVSHTFFTNRRLFIWFLMTLMSKGKRNKDNTEEEESKV